MKWTYKIFRALFVAFLLVLLLTPALLYVMMSTPYCQDAARELGERELSGLLGTDVSVGSVVFTPYNKVKLRDVVIRDDAGDTAAYVRRFGAGIDLNKLIVGDGFEVTYVELIGLDARINKSTAGSSLNIQSIIDALAPKDKSKPPKRFDLSVNNVIIRKSGFSYDVLSEVRDSTRFDRNHIKVTDISADIRLPRVKNDTFDVEVKRFALKEQSGLTLSGLKGVFSISSAGSQVKGFHVAMPGTSIALSDITLDYDGWDDLKARMSTLPLDVSVLSGSYVSTSDFCGLAPKLCGLDAQLSLALEMEGSLNNLVLNELEISSEDENIWLNCKGNVLNVLNKDSVEVNLGKIDFLGYGTDIADLCSALGVSHSVQRIVSQLGRISLDGALSGGLYNGGFKGGLSTAPGNLDLDVSFNRLGKASPVVLAALISTDGVDVGRLLENGQIGRIGAEFDAMAVIDGKLSKASIVGRVDRAEIKGYCYKDLNAVINVEGNTLDGSLNIADDNVNLTVAGEAVLNDGIPEVDLHIEASDIDVADLNLWSKYPGYRLSASIDAIYTGKSFKEATALLTVNGMEFVNDNGEGIDVNCINVDMDNTVGARRIIVNSDFLDGRIDGEYNPATIVAAAKDMLSHSFPALLGERDVSCAMDGGKEQAAEYSDNDFAFNFTIKDNNVLADFVKSPVKLVHPIEITGAFDYPGHQMSLNIDAPYLDQNYKLIKNTALQMNVNAKDSVSQLYVTTTFPTKNGDAEIVVDCRGSDNRLDTRVNWNVLRERTFKGEVDLSTLFGMGEAEDGAPVLTADVSINPSRLVFNDTVWSVSPASVNVAGNRISVEGFDVRRDNQYIKLSGKASPDSEDEMRLSLLNVNLDYIFETLAINNVMFGGNATGTFFASELFSGSPVLKTPGLAVKGLSYNYAVLGDAVIESRWVPEDKAVTINADVSQQNGRMSYIDGAIFPMNDSLDFRFKADKINVAFMRPFMEAFAKDVTGFASGDARLWGNFKYIDMTGDIFAEDLKLKIDFTNTYYTATDSVHLKPGFIEFSGIDLYDMYGNRAKLSGFLKHYCFKRPEYVFNINNAENFLCYDETPERNSLWYGRIFGNGKATVTGAPGNVKIEVHMTTAPKSTFTFVLSDAEEAGEFNFITFRNKGSLNQPIDSITVDPKLEKVGELERIIAERKRQDSTPTKYLMDIHVEATPSAEMVLVMDPIGGDRIRAHGAGDLHLTYASDNEDLFLKGKYALQDGRYNFTLQDIIIKDFIIKSGSSIIFEKDPLAAKLDIQAVYPLNANLSDLDESFLQDTELNRTNVPVHALMKISGDMRQPDVGFDLEFPTLSQDVYRKVRSIVSTDDMMNRQILYLLALNRFYTPEYMASTTKGNELVSVATSTLSSQFSSILGELSDNWNISPNVRSDRGDFSDVEVDLALSSRLLNNRLLFNGNFGYRDESLNNNSFIGDFDIEYLLNQAGNVRLRAYNRYNDQNYYLKTALTTQGVGIVFKRDFDNIFSFLKPKSKKTESVESLETADTIKALPDTIVSPKTLIP